MYDDRKQEETMVNLVILPLLNNSLSMIFQVKHYAFTKMFTKMDKDPLIKIKALVSDH